MIYIFKLSWLIISFGLASVEILNILRQEYYTYFVNEVIINKFTVTFIISILVGIYIAEKINIKRVINIDFFSCNIIFLMGFSTLCCFSNIIISLFVIQCLIWGGNATSTEYNGHLTSFLMGFKDGFLFNIILFKSDDTYKSKFLFTFIYLFVILFSHCYQNIL